MADIFLHSRGRVAAYDNPNGIPMSLFLEGWRGFFGFKSIITQVQVEQQGGVQFVHTLRDFIYIYVFGERIGRMQIQGLSFWDRCDGGFYHGIEWVNAYYLANRTSNRASPVTVVVGLGTPFFGFLVGFAMNYSKPEEQIAEFVLDFRIIPESSALS